MRTELNSNFRVDVAELPDERVIFGCTAAMREVQAKIGLLRSSQLPALIQGESGTGKEVVARFLHAHSDRQDAPFVKLNCAAIPANLVEKELFGCAAAPFGSAREGRPGLVETAEGGTIFLDEIGELDWDLQGELVQLLQNGSYLRVGADERRSACVRLICASNVDLQAAVQQSKFREDLLRLISSVHLRLSALRDRKVDIPQLCEYLLQRLARKLNRIAPRISPSTLQLLKQWDWPGNLRELENWIARAIVFGEDANPNTGPKTRLAVTRGFSARDHRNNPMNGASRRPVPMATNHLILKVLQENHWNRRKTAADLNISYRSLLYKLREVGAQLQKKGHRSFPPRH
jgi:two-component system response regulator AtoC